MSDLEFPEQGPLAVGYIKPRNQPVQPVLGNVVEKHVLIQGCIILGTEEEMAEIGSRVRQNPLLLKNANASLEGSAVNNHGALWPGGVIPWTIDPGFTNPERVKNAIAEWVGKVPSLKFPERKDEKDFIAFRQVASGCASLVGRKGGRQEIWISTNCTTGNVVHEIGHALGLWHEQSRIDRDTHVEVVWVNIDPTKRFNFDQHIQDGRDVGDYDFASIMHYPANAFSINGQPTIRARNSLPAGVVIGQRKKLSDGDIATVKKLYP